MVCLFPLPHFQCLSIGLSSGICVLLVSSSCTEVPELWDMYHPASAISPTPISEVSLEDFSTIFIFTFYCNHPGEYNSHMNRPSNNLTLCSLNFLKISSTSPSHLLPVLQPELCLLRKLSHSQMTHFKFPTLTTTSILSATCPEPLSIPWSSYSYDPFPGGTSGKELTCRCRRHRDMDLISGLGRSLE